MQRDFSLYALIDWGNVSNIFTERSALLARWSHSIEAAVIERQLPVDLVAGFQPIERIAPILPTYQQLTAVAHSVMMLGLPAANIDLSGLNYVSLNANDQLVKEWFLVVRHRDYHRALVAREVEKAAFHGVLTSDPAQVKHFYDALMMLIQRA